MKIILDTNFLISGAEFKVDVFRQLRGNSLYLIAPVMEELERIAGSRRKKKRLARLVLRVLARKRLKMAHTKEKSADRALFMLSRRGYAIATQDIALRKRIRGARGKVLYIRQKKYVVFE